MAQIRWQTSARNCRRPRSWYWATPRSATCWWLRSDGTGQPRKLGHRADPCQEVEARPGLQPPDQWLHG